MYRGALEGEGGGGGQTVHTTPNPHHACLQIPTGPTIAENKLTYSVHNWKACRADGPECESFAYDQEKGGMTREWADIDAFLTWLAIKEAKKSIQLIVSQVKQSDLSIWRERCVYRCTREFTGRKKDWCYGHYKLIHLFVTRDHEYIHVICLGCSLTCM